MSRLIWRSFARLLLGSLVLALHAALGRYLTSIDPIDALVSGARISTAAVLLLFASARAFVWFLLPAWWIAGTLSDLLDARGQRRSDEERPATHREQSAR